MSVTRFLIALSLLGVPSLLFSSTLKIDPVCPVAAGPGLRADGIRVTYDPGASGRLKNAQQLTLQAALNSRRWGSGAVSAPMARTPGGTWEAKLVQREKGLWLYMMLQVRDPVTGAVDNNDGRFWDVVFCQPMGVLHFQSVECQADSHMGYLYPNGMSREQNYDKALAVLDEFMNGKQLDRYNVLLDYWTYKVTRDGRSPAAWQAITTEIREFIVAHKSDKSALGGASNFVRLNQKDLPPELPTHLLELLRMLDPKEAERYEALTEHARISWITDAREKADALGTFAKRYPSADTASNAIAQRFKLLYDLHDFAAAEQLVRERMQASSPSADAYFALAAVYVWSHQKLDEALKLLDQAEEMDKKTTHASFEPGYLLLSPVAGGHAAGFADFRRKAYMLQNKPELALPEALKAVEAEPTFSRMVALGNIYEAVGEKQKAVDTYFQAATEISGEQHKAMEPLEKLWVAEKLGTIEQLRAKVDAKIHEDQDKYFREAKYVPDIVDYPVNPFDFTTRAGERVRSSELGDKILVLNVWAIWCGPCLPELPGFIELQRKHPEIRVVTLTQKADSEKLNQYLRDEHLESLPVAEDNHAFEQLASSGVPETYVIQSGRVRVYHQDYLSNVVAYIEADLAALKAAPLGKLRISKR